MEDVVAVLRAAGCVFAEEEAQLLAEAAEDAADLARLVTARAGGTPLEQLVGWAEFDGLRIRVAPGVFVPRQRSTFLVEVAAAIAPRHGSVVDLCCGTGALLAALSARRPDLDGHAADLDPSAVACARLNLPADRVHQGDLYSPLPEALRGRIDLLMVNAPYVPTSEIAQLPREARDHEHRCALDGGEDGLDVHRRVAAGAATWLAPHGVLLIEVAGTQIAAAVELLSAQGLRPETRHDDERRTTIICATRQIP